MNLETFAAERRERLEQNDDLLRPVVQAALEAYLAGSQGWMDALVDVLSAMFTDLFEIEYPEGSVSEMREAFLATVRESLERTSRPAGEVTEAQRERIVYWLSGYVLNAATEAAAKAMSSDGQDVVKTWLTMLDSDVREIHRPLHGQTREVDATFDVAGTSLQYPGEPLGPPAVWIQCRCVLAIGTRESMAEMTANLTDNVAAGATITVSIDNDMELATEEEELQPLEDDPSSGEPVPWHGVLAPEDVPTGDGRMFAAGSMRHRPLPIPLMWQPSNEPGHDGAVVVGRIDKIWRDGALIKAEGVFSSSEEADKVVIGVAEGVYGGVSVDVDDATFELRDPDGQVLSEDQAFEPGVEVLQVITDGRISAATMVSIPAFAEAFIALGPWEEAEEPAEDEDGMAAAAVAFRRGPGWVTHPKETSRLHNYWVRGEGAAKIGWGTPGDFNRCRTQLSKYLPARFLTRTCAEWHHDATGTWPGPNAHGGGKHSGEPAPAFNLVAAAPMIFRSEFFEDPGLNAPTPLTVTEDGHVYGHVATWGTCHIGISGVCTTPPTSRSSYAYFHTGRVSTDQGDIAVGALTVDTGHAALSLKAGPALAHYDNTGTAWAYVRAGEDAHGIWVSGQVRPDVDDAVLTRAKASALSGDWRRIGNGLEMVAALSVNVPGFPIPEVSLAASAGEQTALVASGVIVPGDDETEKLKSVVAAAVRETLAAQKREARAAELKAKVRANRVRTLKEKI